MHSLDLIGDWPVEHAAGAVVRSDGVLETFGETSRQFRLASVTKLLVGYAALIAVEEGVVDLDDPAGPPGATVRHLLAHASGLDFAEPVVRATPGTRRIYSSAGFEVLAEVIATRSQFRFSDYLAEAVFAPLGMTDTVLTGSAGHGASSTVADLSRFAAELLAPALIDISTLRAATTVQFPGLTGVLPGYGMQRPNDWGLGFEIKAGKHPHWTGTDNSPATYGHFGQSGTFVWVDPAVAAACVVLTDRDFGDWAKPRWPELSDAVLGELAG